MSVRLDDDVIRLEGRCHVEDAEPLLLLLQADPGRRLDLSQAESIHSAIVQIMLACSPQLIGDCGDIFVRDWVIPLLADGGGEV
jgi:hypothetical protein